MMTKRLLIPIIFLFTTMNAAAQSSWHMLPNSGLLDGGYQRYEDIYFTDSTTGYVVSLAGTIYKTTDAGVNWTLQYYKSTRGGFRSIEFLDDKLTGIAGSLDTTGKVYRTSDSGATWTEIGSTIADTSRQNKRMICGIAHQGNTFYAVGSWSSKQAKLYKSTDKGLNWTVYAFDTSLISSAVDVCFTSQDTGFVTGGQRSGTAPFYNQGSVVLKTTDGGLTWRRVFYDTGIGGRIWKIQALSSGLLVGSIEPYYTDTVAMIRSINSGANWTIIGTGYHKHSQPTTYGTQGIGFINAQHGWLGGYYLGHFETNDGGATWNEMGFGANFNRFFVLDSSHVFAGGQDIYFYGRQIPQVPNIVVQRNRNPPHRLYPVSPNPASGRVKIEFDLLQATYVLLQVAATDAKRTWELKSAFLPKGHYTYYWDGSHAPAGNYIIWLGTNEIPVVQKFILQH